MSEEITTAIPIESILESKNVRTTVGDLSSLMESIEQHGLLEPLVIWPHQDKDGFYELGWGFRRLAAIRKLGWTKLMLGRHVILMKAPTTKEDFIAKNLAENIQRLGLDPIDIGKKAEELYQLGRSIPEISAMTGLREGRIKRAIELFKRAPEPWHKDIGYEEQGFKRQTAKIGASVASRIVRLAPEKVKSAIWFEVKRRKLTGGQTDILLRLILNGYTLERALHQLDRFSIHHFDFVINKKKMEPILQRYKTTLSNLIVLCIEGQVKLPNGVVFGSKKRVVANIKKTK